MPWKVAARFGDDLQVALDELDSAPVGDETFYIKTGDVVVDGPDGFQKVVDMEERIRGHQNTVSASSITRFSSRGFEAAPRHDIDRTLQAALEERLYIEQVVRLKCTSGSTSIRMSTSLDGQPRAEPRSRTARQT